MTSVAEQTGRLDATNLSNLVNNREISVSELVDGAIERLEKVNGQLNAVITAMYAEARAGAVGQLVQTHLEQIEEFPNRILDPVSGKEVKTPDRPTSSWETGAEMQ